MRNRLEDLGRLNVLIRKILEDMPVFQLIQGRDKDFSEEFYEYTSEKQEDLLHGLAYGISQLKEELYECLAISEGTDDLNAMFDMD